MKAHMYWTYATRSQLRGGQRSLLAVFCIAIGVASVVALQLVSNAINLGLTSNVRLLNGGDLAITDTVAPLTGEQLSYFDQLKSDGTLTGYTAVDAVSGEFHVRAGKASRFFQVNAVDPETFPLADAPTFTDGASRSLSSLLTGDQVVITTGMAQALGLRVGDAEQLYTNDGRSLPVTIAGIIQSKGFFNGSLLLVNIARMAAQPSLDGQSLAYSAVYADVPEHSDANATAAEKLIQARFPLASQQTAQQAQASNAKQVQQIQYFLQMVALLALLIGGVGIVNTMQVLLRRRRIEIATLKTVGYRRGDLYAMFGLEAGLVGLLGGVIGAAAGVGGGLLVKPVIEASLQVALPAAIDPWMVGSGLAVGFVTALIFGLLPIIQAAQVRPQAVLRETPERAGWQGAVLTALLLALFVVMFFALALAILRDPRLTALAVGSAAGVLAVLGLLFGGVVWVISRFPVLERMRWWYVALVIVALAASGALLMAVPAFGALCLVVTLLAAALVVMPKSWKVNVKLALRSIGRQKARTVTTLLALYIGVFAIALILVLGQNISVAINSYLLSGNALNAEVIASSADRAAVEAQLARTSGIQNQTEVPFTRFAPVAVNGQPIALFIEAATASGTYSASDVAGVMNGAQGYDLAGGATLDLTDTPISSGRSLNAGDAGMLNALLPLAASQAPNNLKLGDSISVASRARATPITFTIIGFYNSKIPQFGPMLVDSAAVDTLSGGKPEYGFRMRLDPTETDAKLAAIQSAIPNAVTYNFSDFADQYATLLNNLIDVLIAVTSLAMLASVIIIANTVGLTMLERRREIGILKAVGYTSRAVLGEVIVENGVIGFTGAFLALALVMVAATILGKTAFDLTIVVPTPIVLGVAAATVIVCVVVAALVAWQSTRVRPVEVLRYE
ncbi:MAG TPA: FtsX-like permease family protein [Ktedonobacterales bacterium]